MEKQIYNCLIVDDEPPAREILKRYIAQIPNLSLSAEFGNALDAISFLHQQTVDILLLDVQMPQLSGLELIRTMVRPPKVIFTTAFADYAVSSYELNAIDYLLKPISFERFLMAINKAIPQNSFQSPQNITEIPTAPSFLYFRSERKMVKVILQDIYYIESIKDYVKIVTKGQTLVTKYTMEAMDVILPNADFLRIHRSFIVSKSQVQSFSNSHLQLDKIQLPIGKLYQRETYRQLSKTDI